MNITFIDLKNDSQNFCWRIKIVYKVSNIDHIWFQIKYRRKLFALQTGINYHFSILWSMNNLASNVPSVEELSYKMLTYNT